MVNTKKAKAPATGTRKGFQVNQPKGIGEFEVDTTAKSQIIASELPTFQQLVTLALVSMEYSLQRLIDIRCHDEDWDDEDVSVDYVCELALSQIRIMQNMELKSSSHFERHWYQAASAMELASKVFSRKDCVYERCLKSVCSSFEKLAALVEFVEKREQMSV